MGRRLTKMTEPQQPDLPFSIKKINVSSEGKRKLIGEWKIEPPIFPPIDFSDETVEFIKDEIIKELTEQNNEQMNAVLLHPECYKYLTRKSHKKIKRRIHYSVYFFYNGKLESHYFESAKKMRKFVNNIHEIVDSTIPGVRIKKTFCYREHTARHEWHYESYCPGSYELVEKW
jgi:hypothetical protein